MSLLSLHTAGGSSKSPRPAHETGCRCPLFRTKATTCTVHQHTRCSCLRNFILFSLTDVVDSCISEVANGCLVVPVSFIVASIKRAGCNQCRHPSESSSDLTEMTLQWLLIHLVPLLSGLNQHRKYQQPFLSFTRLVLSASLNSGKILGLRLLGIIEFLLCTGSFELQSLTFSGVRCVMSVRHHEMRGTSATTTMSAGSTAVSPLQAWTAVQKSANQSLFQ